ncbi:unnamed protein product, partial [Ectocarpus sp. 4 AP-2014]
MDRATRWFGPVEVGFGRVASAAVLLAILWATIDRRQRLRRGEIATIIGIALLSNAYPYTLQPSLISSGLGHSFFGMTVSFVPLMTILVSIPLLGVRPTSKQIVGVLGGLGFVILLMYDGNLRGITPWQLALAVTIPLSYALGNTVMRRNLKDADPTPLSVFMMLASTAALLPIVASPALQTQIGVEAPSPRVDFPIAAAALFGLGALGTGACVWAFVRMVQQRGPLFAGMVTYVVPVLAMLWGLIDGETITSRQVIAMTGILSMVALVQAPA